MSKGKHVYPRHILLTLEQDTWASEEAERLDMSVGAYFRQLADDDQKRKVASKSLNTLLPSDRANRRREPIQVSIHNDDENLALAIAKALKKLGRS